MVGIAFRLTVPRLIFPIRMPLQGQLISINQTLCLMLPPTRPWTGPKPSLS
jgi:hypothetical protein